MRKLFYTLAGAFFIPLSLLAQSGRITGKVMHAGSGQSLPSASLTLIEKSITIAADQNGNFSFGKLVPGTYSIQCSYAGYISKQVEEIVVTEKENTSIVISLEQKTSEAVIIKSTKVKAAGETTASLLIAQKNSANVSDGITAESIKKTPDRSTSDVLKRVSGASIQDDRFAVIRGLSDRYNAAFINGAPLPSSESDRKAFAFDIFPSAILDNLVIYKTATPDKTGEFAGGIIEITTKSILPKNFTSINYGLTHNSLSTGNYRLHSENSGKTDWLGLDDGTRGIPAGIPSTAAIKNVLSFADRADLARLFKNYKWGVLKTHTKPNYNFQLSQGFNIERNGSEFLGALLSVNYNRNFYFNEGERNSFDPPPYMNDPADTSGAEPIQRARYKDSVYNDEVIVAALANFAVKLNNRSSISWKSNLSINTDSKLIKRKGNYDYANEPDGIISQTVRWYTSNQIFSSQLAGEHLLGSKKTRINWLSAFSKVERDIPNLSRSGGTIVSPPNQLSGAGSMFFANSDEKISSVKTDVTQPYTLFKNTQNLLKAGVGYQVRKRLFSSRTLGFVPYSDNNGTQFDYSLLLLPDDQIFLESHLGKMKNGKGGFMLGDGTLSNSDYNSSSELTHAYLMNDQRFLKKFRLIYGLRLEKFNQKLSSIKNLNEPVAIDTTVTDILPSINFVYALSSKINVRLSYSTTVNRPEFRELAPFLFFDYQTSFLMEGEVALQRALIRNYDFRFEFFPGKVQLFSLSAFYKQFDKPIELVSLPLTTSQTKYQNARSAKVYGIEAEIRTLLSTLVGSNNEKSLLNKFTLTANAAFIKSNVQLDSIGLITVEQLSSDRALQGQSPYIINTSLSFNDDKSGFSATASLNRVGDRIYIAGTYFTPDIYEKARSILDFQLAKFFMNKTIELKFTMKDLLSQNVNYYFDYDRSKDFTPKDRYFSSFKMPKSFSLSVGLKL